MLSRGAGGVLDGRLIQLIAIARERLASAGATESSRWVQTQPSQPGSVSQPLPPWLRGAPPRSKERASRGPSGAAADHLRPASNRPPPIALRDALLQVKEGATAKFDETVDLALNLGTDPRRGDHMVRGVASLPHGTGKAVRVAVFAQGDAAAAAKTAGAEVVGGEELIARILAGGSGAIDFDKCLATPELMPKLGRIARVLGPRGLMPNPKLGTIVTDVTPAIKAMKEGRVEFRADKGAVLHAGVGKASFPPEHLYSNIAALVQALLNSRPKGLKGSGAGGYLMRASVSSTMGHSVPVSIPSIVQAVQLARAGKA